MACGGRRLRRSSRTTRPCVRPAARGATPQVIVADPTVTYVQFALSDSGAAIATWDGCVAGRDLGVDPARGRRVGRAGAGRRTARNLHGVAMSAAGDAVVLFRDSTPGAMRVVAIPACRRVRGAPTRGAREPLLRPIKRLMVEFDGLGRAVAAANFREFDDTVRVNVRSVGRRRVGRDGPGLDDDGDRRHRRCAVSWTRWCGTRRAPSRPGRGSRRRRNSNYEVVVSRLSGAGWDTPKAFAVSGSALRRVGGDQCRRRNPAHGDGATAAPARTCEPRRSRRRSPRPGRT